MSFLPDSISTLDILLVIVLALFVMRGALHGFMQEISGFIGLLLGVMLAGKYSMVLLDYLYPYITTMAWAYAIAYMGILIATVILVGIFFKLLQAFITVKSAPWLTYLGGALAGFAKGLLLTSVALVFMQAYFGGMPFMRSSALAPYVEQVSSLFREYLSDVIQVVSGV